MEIDSNNNAAVIRVPVHQQERMKSDYAKYSVLVGIVSIIILLLSLFLLSSKEYVLPPYLSTSGFLQKLNDTYLMQLLSIGLWTSAFLLIDFIMDAVEYIIGNDTIRGVYVGRGTTINDVYGFSLEWLVRLMFISGLGIQSLVQYAAPNNNGKIVLAFFVESYTRIVAVVLCAATMGDTFDQGLLERRGSFLITVSFSFCQLVVYFCSLSSSQTDIVVLVGVLGRIGVWASFLVLCFLWIWCWRSLVSRALVLGRQSITTKEWTFTMYSILFGVFIIVYLSIRGVDGSGGGNGSLSFSHLETSSVLSLRLHIGTWIVYAVVAVLLPVRIARYSVRMARHRIISTKRDVSELINEPLKVAQTTLSHILQTPDLLAAWRDHLTLVATACETTIEKLALISTLPDDDEYTTASLDAATVDGRFRGAVAPASIPPADLDAISLSGSQPSEAATGRHSLHPDPPGDLESALASGVHFKASSASVGIVSHRRVLVGDEGGVTPVHNIPSPRPSLSPSLSSIMGERMMSSLTQTPRLSDGGNSRYEHVLPNLAVGVDQEVEDAILCSEELQVPLLPI